MEFFRHCPQCGRKFHIKLESKKLVTSHMESIPRWEHRAVVVRSTGRYTAPALTPINVQEGRPIIVDVEEFQYAYKCEHCGHEWSETHVEEHKEG
jgi:DNA-directed RNA polymerase subunit RPC12/RpoP